MENKQLISKFWADIIKEQKKLPNGRTSKAKICEVRRCFWHKDLVLLLSIVPTMTGTAALWTTHEWGGPQVSLQILSDVLMKSHIKQIDRMILQDYLSEPEEYKIHTIEDQTNTHGNEIS